MYHPPYETPFLSLSHPILPPLRQTLPLLPLATTRNQFLRHKTPFFLFHTQACFLFYHLPPRTINLQAYQVVYWTPGNTPTITLLWVSIKISILTYLPIFPMRNMRQQHLQTSACSEHFDPGHHSYHKEKAYHVSVTEISLAVGFSN